jgi:2-polyprenyl-3-methyl-5-hydroxy-6-metoxy-1,4-benzoquinol methylase
MSKLGELAEQGVLARAISRRCPLTSSRSALARAKWKTIRKYISEVENVTDVGCGDLSFWEGQRCENYAGIDISPFILERNRRIWSNGRFIHSPAEEYVRGLEGDVVLCMDLLFHIIDDDVYVKILQNLTAYPHKWILIYTLRRNSFKKMGNRFYTAISYVRRNSLNKAVRAMFLNTDTDEINMKYRPFEDYLKIFKASGFRLRAVEISEVDDFCALYVFQKGNCVIDIDASIRQDRKGSKPILFRI